jgi:hypothetical protein
MVRPRTRLHGWHMKAITPALSSKHLIAAAMVGLLLAVAHASPVHAHEHCVFHTYDKACNHGTGHPDAHTAHYVDGCDGEVDGHRVRTHFNLSNVSGTLNGRWAPSQGCIHDFQSSYFGHLVRQRICEEVVGCSDWLWH